MVSAENAKLIQEYLDIAEHASENLERFSKLLSDDCVWYITPPGLSIRGKEQVRSFSGMAMGSRSHSSKAKVEIRRWFAEGNHFCLEYNHRALISVFHIPVEETVCLVCHIREGKIDSVHEYVDTSHSLLIGLGLQLLPVILKMR